MTTQRLTQNNRPDKNNQTQRQRGAGGREGRKPSQCQQGSSACPGRDGRVEPGRLMQSRDPGREPGRSRRDGPLEVCTGSKLKPEPGPYPRLSDPTRPDPSGTVKFRARTRPEIHPPPTHSQQKKKEKGCISRLHAKK